jgi:diphosphomevalonate decarboxylase
VTTETKKLWTAEAPSNIALIKYMGKVETNPLVKNRPTNTSLSFTLPHLKSFVQLEYDPAMKADVWEPLSSFGDKKFAALKLSRHGSSRFLAHLAMIRDQFQFQGSFVVRSANDFPSDCGLASSASSFAALTKVTVAALSELTEKPVPSISRTANWSRLGSGSSCRSFFEPWSLWTPDEVREVPSLERFGQLLHQVIVVDEEVKAVSSSEAHKRVTSSLLFNGRPERADARATSFISALENEKWQDAFEIAWAEFWDMHALFETAEKPFGYMTGGSLEVLKFVRDQLWAVDQDGPLVTMDAGPNVHVLYKNTDQGKAQAQRLAKQVSGKFKVFSSETK